MQVTGRVGVLSRFVGGDHYGAIIAGVNQAARAAGGRVIAPQTLDPGGQGPDHSDVPDFRRQIAWQHFDAAIVTPPSWVQARGDGFVVLLEGLASADETPIANERIHAAPDEPLMIEGRPVRVVAGVGVARSGDGAELDAARRSASDDAAASPACEPGRPPHAY